MNAETFVDCISVARQRQLGELYDFRVNAGVFSHVAINYLGL